MHLETVVSFRTSFSRCHVSKWLQMNKQWSLDVTSCWIWLKTSLGSCWASELRDSHNTFAAKWSGGLSSSPTRAVSLRLACAFLTADISFLFLCMTQYSAQVSSSYENPLALWGLTLVRPQSSVWKLSASGVRIEPSVHNIDNNIVIDVDQYQCSEIDTLVWMSGL